MMPVNDIELFVVIREYFPGTYEHMYEATSYDIAVFAPGAFKMPPVGHGPTVRAAQDDLYRQVAAVLPVCSFVRTGEDEPVRYAPRARLCDDNAAFDSILTELSETKNTPRFMALVNRVIDECSDSQKDKVYELFGKITPENR